MKALQMLALAAALPELSAQDAPAAASVADLPHLRAAFAATKAPERAAIIAVVQGNEPVILTAGRDAAGEDLTRLTLVPLLSLAKVLAADAICVQRKGEIDQGSGEKLGDRELTVRELLDGVTLLPDFFVLDGGNDAVDASLLRACGAMAAGARMQLQGGGLGAAEFVLLEPLAFGGRHKEWTSMLRSTLAPHVSGLDPVSADELGEQRRGGTILAIADLAKLATAQPVLLRTLLSLQNIGTWLQWRTQREVPLWTSARMGRTMPSLTKPEEPRWVKNCLALGVSTSLAQYPSRKAALLWIGPPGGTTSFLQPLHLAFEGDLHATGGEAAQARAPQERLRAAAAARGGGAPPDTTVPRALEGTRWCSTAADGRKTVRLAFDGKADGRCTVTLDGESLSFSMTRMGDGLRATPCLRANVMFRLWLRPEPGADEPTKLTCVLCSSRTSGMDSPDLIGAGASIPHYFELVPEKN